MPVLVFASCNNSGNVTPPDSSGNLNFTMQLDLYSFNPYFFRSYFFDLSNRTRFFPSVLFLSIFFDAMNKKGEW